MRLRVVALGQRMPPWVDAGWDDYARRMPPEFPVDLAALKPEPRDRGKSVAQILAAEALRIATACRNASVVALDERGERWTTRALSDKLAQWRIEARDVTFVIGSADGLDASLKRDADAMVALSSFTLPHGLVRVMMAEQLYRAISMNAGHPYHRE